MQSLLGAKHLLILLSEVLNRITWHVNLNVRLLALSTVNKIQTDWLPRRKPRGRKSSAEVKESHGRLYVQLYYFLTRVTKGSYSLSERVLHQEKTSASSYSFQYPLLSVRSSSSCLRLLPWVIREPKFVLGS